MKKIILALFMPMACQAQDDSLRVWSLMTDFKNDSNQLDNFKWGVIYALSKEGDKLGTFVAITTEPDNTWVSSGAVYKKNIRTLNWRYEFGIGPGLNYGKMYGVSVHAHSYLTFETKRNEERARRKLLLFSQTIISEGGWWYESSIIYCVRKWLGFGVRSQAQGANGISMSIIQKMFSHNLTVGKRRITIGVTVKK